MTTNSPQGQQAAAPDAAPPSVAISAAVPSGDKHDTKAAPTPRARRAKQPAAPAIPETSTPVVTLRKRASKKAAPAKPPVDAVPTLLDPAPAAPTVTTTPPVRIAPKKTAGTPERSDPTEPNPIEPDPTEPDPTEPKLGEAQPTESKIAKTGSDGRTRKDLPSDADLTRAVRARPQLMPAALAIAAVGRFGESAQEHADWLRATYPDVAAERLAQDAVRTAGRRARYAVGSALIGGPLGIAAGISTMTWAHARLVIDISAIFGRDPLDPARAADVLVLLGAYPDALAARKAVAELAGDVVEIEATEAKASLPMLLSTTTTLVTRAVSRILPGTAILAAAIRGTSETERLATRAIRYFA